MAILSVMVSLQFCPERRGIELPDLDTILGLGLDREIAITRGPKSSSSCALASFKCVRISDCQAAKEPWDELDRRLRELMHFVATFLDALKLTVVTDLKQLGWRTKLIVEPRMDQDQLDIDLPPLLIAACARIGLGIYLITNDVSVEEIRERHPDR